MALEKMLPSGQAHGKQILSLMFEGERERKKKKINPQKLNRYNPKF